MSAIAHDVADRPPALPRAVTAVPGGSNGAGASMKCAGIDGEAGGTEPALGGSEPGDGGIDPGGAGIDGVTFGGAESVGPPCCA
jgi:hypothetical protein